MRDHPVFARVYRLLLALGEPRSLTEMRREALAGATGRLLVVGLGPGRDLDLLPPGVTEVLAVEPDRTMRAAARDRVARSRIPVRLIAAAGERLPLPDACVDSALCGLVLCSVDDPARVLAEVRRVLRPGAPLGVLEHVRDAEGTRLGRVQDRSARFWSAIAGGCRPNRRTRPELELAGFDTAGVRDARLPTGLPLLVPHLVGTARAPGDPAA